MMGTLDRVVRIIISDEVKLEQGPNKVTEGMCRYLGKKIPERESSK